MKKAYMAKWGVVGLFLGMISLKFLFLPTAFIEGVEDMRFAVSKDAFKLNQIAPQGGITNIRVLIAADEEYRRYMDTFGRGWMDEALIIIEKADDAFYRDLDINFVVTGYAEWNSRKDEKDGRKLLEDAQSELKWTSGSKEHDILVVYTGQKIDGYAGWAEHYSGSPKADAVIVQHQFDFWKRDKDWHVLQEELSHLFGAPDHVSPDDPIYWSEDIMSYKWLYYTDKWDVSCREIIEKNKHRFAQAS
jgi:hypothetical protein